MRHLSYLTVFVFAIFAAPVATQAGDPAVPPAGSDYGNAAQPDQGGLLAPVTGCWGYSSVSGRCIVKVHGICAMACQRLFLGDPRCFVRATAQHSGVDRGS